MSEDRTTEFLNLARHLPKDGNSSSLSSIAGAKSVGRYGGSETNTSSSSADLKAFHKTAANISRDIAGTSALLSELTQMVRQKSLFADDSQRINALVIQIKSNVESLNGRLDQAQVVINTQKRKLGKGSQAGQEASNLVGQLKEEFVEATAGFKKVLQQRTDVMKETTDLKRQVYGMKDTHGSGLVVSLENKPPVYHHPDSSSSGGGVGGTSALSAAAGRPMGAFPTLDLTSGMAAGESTSSASQLPRPHGATGFGGSMDLGVRNRSRGSGDNLPTYSGTYSSLSSVTSPLTPLDIQRMEHEQPMQQMQLIPDQDYLRERADAMSTVESHIVELGTIFNKLAVMVSEHRDMVQRVEDNVDNASTNITLSLSTLTDTLESLQTNRALFFKILAVLVIFIIGFVVFVA